MGSNDTIYHYGVKGMKWGVRKNPSKAFEKATKKADRLQKKVDKRTAKAEKAQKKLDKSQKRWAGWGLSSNKTLLRRTKKVARLNRKVTKITKKQEKWANAMVNEFSNVKMSDLSKESIEKGRKYISMLRK